MPGNAKVLMLGSFPPPERRWSMHFYYPNRTNDMWRIMGIVFFGDKNHFVRPGGYDEQAIRRFAAERGIAMFDAAVRVVRLKDNASDKFLEIVAPTDISELLSHIPQCKAIVTTGQKATDTLCQLFSTTAPSIGNGCPVCLNGRNLTFFRMPSSSRAYPLSLERKAAFYKGMLETVGILNG